MYNKENNHYNCIYMYINKINGHKYVGQTNNFKRRHNEHINQSYNKKRKRDYDMIFHKAIRKYGIENFEIVILKENLNSQCLLNIWEDYYINKYDCLSKENYNSARAGYSNPYANKTEEEMRQIRKKMSDSQKGKRHKPCSEETKRKISEANKGKKRSEEQRQNISNGKTKNSTINKKYSKRKTDNIMFTKTRQIAQYDKQGNLIKIWKSIKEASSSLNIPDSSITTCCKYWDMNCDRKEWIKKYNKYPNKTAGGFIWKYI